MDIVVLATASRIRGALTIYNQFVTHLKDESGDDNYYVFVHKSMPMPQMPRVHYIVMDTTSMLSRMYFDYYGCNRYLMKNGISPDVIVSLQNTGIRTHLPQVIYYHQPTPLYPYQWNPFKKAERSLFFYKFFYPFFVKTTRNSHTHYVVQIRFMKDGLVRIIKCNPDKVHILFPDVEQLEDSAIEPYSWGDEYLHFVYPASVAKFKRHDVLIHALSLAEQKENVRIHFTIGTGERPDLDALIKKGKLNKQIIMEGAIDHAKLLSMLKSSSGLLFPSQMETLGLPLLEAAACGVPIVAANMDYSRQVVGDYEGIRFVDVNDYKRWANAIDIMTGSRKQYKPIKKNKSSWPMFFELIRNCTNH